MLGFMPKTSASSLLRWSDLYTTMPLLFISCIYIITYVEVICMNPLFISRSIRIYMLLHSEKGNDDHGTAKYHNRKEQNDIDS